MCATPVKQEAQNPIIIPCHRLMEAFAKSDDERDFYIDRHEGFIIYVDLDKNQEELDALYEEIDAHPDRYCTIPKLSYYETKKIMEGFVNEKVYDIDTKEKLLDIIQSKEARENFMEFIHDHHAEQEKWQQFYQERSRVRIIEWLRINHFHFVFEEDLDLPRTMIEKLKQSLFQSRVSKEILNARKVLVLRAKIYYSNEALNPRPKRGRPPKQAVKLEVEPQVTVDLYTSVPLAVRPFLFTPEHSSSFSFTLFSEKYEKEAEFIQRKMGLENLETASLTQKLSSLRSLSSKWKEEHDEESERNPYGYDLHFEDSDEDDDEDEEEFDLPKAKKSKPQAGANKDKPKAAKQLNSSNKAPLQNNFKKDANQSSKGVPANFVKNKATTPPKGAVKPVAKKPAQKVPPKPMKKVVAKPAPKPVKKAPPKIMPKAASKAPAKAGQKLPPPKPKRIIPQPPKKPQMKKIIRPTKGK